MLDGLRFVEINIQKCMKTQLLSRDFRYTTWGILKSVFGFGCMVFNVTFNNIAVISQCSVLLMEETGVLGENHRPVARH